MSNNMAEQLKLIVAKGTEHKVPQSNVFPFILFFLILFYFIIFRCRSFLFGVPNNQIKFLRFYPFIFCV